MVTHLALTVALALAGAETDNYYAWFVDIDDGADAINAHVNAVFTEQLAQVNASQPEARTCSDVAMTLLHPLWNTGTWFVMGATDDWGFDYRPRTSTERTQLDALGVYRVNGLLPLGFFVPVDPTVRVGDVYMGTDKISHFFHNSRRLWHTYSAARADGRPPDEAVATAIERGVLQEAGVLGSGVVSSFSYADLEANYQGLEMIRGWCERGGLVRDADGWRLVRPVDLREWVNPCWDESFYPNAYSGMTATGVLEALPGYCAALDDPRVAARRAHYARVGCTSPSVQLIDARIAAGELPDPAPFDVNIACGRAPLRRTYAVAPPAISIAQPQLEGALVP